MQLNPWANTPVLDQGCVDRRGSSPRHPTRRQHLIAAAAAALGHTEGMAYICAAGTDVPSKNDAGPPSWSSTSCRDITCTWETQPYLLAPHTQTHEDTHACLNSNYRMVHPRTTHLHNPRSGCSLLKRPSQEHRTAQLLHTAAALRARTNQGQGTAQLCGMWHTIPCPSPATQHRLSLQAAQCGAGWAAAGSRRERPHTAASRNRRGAPSPPAVKNGASSGPPAGPWAAKPSTRP
jgi:hypothetical protein